MVKDNLFNLQKRIIKASKKQESYNTGIVGESIIIAGYKTMKIADLEKLRVILNRIIKEKKEFKRVAELT